jgi:cobalt/nickel transport system ATP-binding protein
MSDIGIETRALAFSYPDGTIALDGVSFRAAAGECVGLLGANGAGKSTILELLAGLLPGFRGEAWVAGVAVARSNLRELRRRLGFVFQDPDDQLFSSSVGEDVAFGPRNLGLDEAEVEARAGRALEAVGIAHLVDRPPFRLSGGEKRAAAIAAAISMDPEVLLLDEPTSALDPRARRRTMGLIASLGQTRLVATHDMDLALELCDRVVVLAKGKIAAEGAAGDVLLDARLMEGCGLELPLSVSACRACRSGARTT